MMTAIRTALDPSDSQEHVRIVSFMTDGYVGNDMAILDEIQKHPNARIFSFGIGSSVNRFLLEKMARFGRGEVEFVGLQDDGSTAARRFHERIRNPLLTDIAVDFGGLPVADVYPKQIPDLFSAKPVVLTGRYTGESRGSIRLTGKMSGRAFERTVPVSFSRSAKDHDVLATMWARTRIADLTSQDYAGIQNGNPRAEIKEQITQLGLDYRLMTQFTSFVAVEEKVVTEGGRPRRVDVPVEMPHGVSYEGVFGDKKEMVGRRRLAKSMAANQAVGFGGRVLAQDAAAPISPPYRQGQERVKEPQSVVRPTAESAQRRAGRGPGERDPFQDPPRPGCTVSGRRTRQDRDRSLAGGRGAGNVGGAQEARLRDDRHSQSRQDYRRPDRDRRTSRRCRGWRASATSSS